MNAIIEKMLEWGQKWAEGSRGTKSSRQEGGRADSFSEPGLRQRTSYASPLRDSLQFYEPLSSHEYRNHGRHVHHRRSAGRVPRRTSFFPSLQQLAFPDGSFHRPNIHDETTWLILLLVQLAMAVLGTTFAGGYLALRGDGKKKEAGPPINAKSNEEEAFIKYVMR